MKKRLKELRKGKRWSRYFLMIRNDARSFLSAASAKIMSYGAAELFNYAASRQEMLRGTITVESITANIHGGVTFEKLAWDDPGGESHPSCAVRIFQGRSVGCAQDALRLYDHSGDHAGEPGLCGVFR